jgi:hypothetical protein
MRYPTEMRINEVVVPVTYVTEPVRVWYTCTQCNSQHGFKPGEEHVCPVCKSTWMKYDELYANGVYNYRDVAITLTDNGKEAMVGFNLVHETIEAINALCDLCLDHTQISTLGMNLYGAFSSGRVDFTPGQQQQLAAAA